MGNKSGFWRVLNRSLSKQSPSSTNCTTSTSIDELPHGSHHVDFAVIQHWIIDYSAVSNAHEIANFSSDTDCGKIQAVVQNYVSVCSHILQCMQLPKESTTLYAEGSSEKSEQRDAAIRASLKRKTGWKDSLVRAMGRPPLWFTLLVLKVLEKEGWKWVAAAEGSQADTLILNALRSSESANHYVHSVDADFLAFSPANFTLVKREGPRTKQPQLLERKQVLKLLGMCAIVYHIHLMLLL